MTQDVYFSNHSFVFPPAALDALKSYRRAVRKTPAEVLLSLGTMAIRDRHDGLLNFEDMCQALHWLRPYQVKVVCQDLIDRGALLRLSEEVVWLVGFTEKNYSRTQCVERARRVNSQPRLSRMPPEKLQAIAANTHLGLGIPQDCFAYSLASKGRADATPSPASPLEPKEKKTNVCLSQATFKKPPPMPHAVALQAADAFEATLPDQGELPKQTPEPAPPSVPDAPKPRPDAPAAPLVACPDQGLAEMMARALAIGEGRKGDADKAPKPSQTPRRAEPKAKPPAIPVRPLEPFRPRQQASGLPPGMRRPDLGPLNIYEVEQGLAALGVDPVPGTRDEAERMFSQLVMAKVDLGQWRYGIHAVAMARSRGEAVANPVAYAWRVIRAQQQQAEGKSSPPLDAAPSQRVQPNLATRAPAPAPGEGCLARALGMVGIKGIPGIRGAPR